jgi:hypothetical protein
MNAPLVVAVTSAAALAAGCGSAADEEATNRAGDDKATVTSARIEARAEFEYGSAADEGVPQLAYTGEGSYDWGRGVGRLKQRTAGESGADDYVVKLIALPDSVFTSLPAEQFDGKRWLESHRESRLGGAPLSWLSGYDVVPADPSDVLAHMREKSDDLKLVGWEAVRGTRTAHYRAHLDYPAVRDLIDPDHHDETGDRLLLEAWVDAEGLAQRIRATMPPPGPQFRVTLEFFDFGVPVEVERPPVEEVVTDEEFMRLAREHGADCGRGASDTKSPGAQSGYGEGWTSYSELCLIPFTEEEHAKQ